MARNSQKQAEKSQKARNSQLKPENSQKKLEIGNWRSLEVIEGHWMSLEVDLDQS